MMLLTTMMIAVLTSRRTRSKTVESTLRTDLRQNISIQQNNADLTLTEAVAVQIKGQTSSLCSTSYTYLTYTTSCCFVEMTKSLACDVKSRTSNQRRPTTTCDSDWHRTTLTTATTGTTSLRAPAECIAHTAASRHRC